MAMDQAGETGVILIYIVSKNKGNPGSIVMSQASDCLLRNGFCSDELFSRGDIWTSWIARSSDCVFGFELRRFV